MCVCIYIYIHTHTHIYIYIYIHICCDRGKEQRDYTFIPISLFRECLLIGEFIHINIYCIYDLSQKCFNVKIYMIRMIHMIRDTTRSNDTYSNHKLNKQREKCKICDTWIAFVRPCYIKTRKGAGLYLPLRCAAPS